MTASSASPLAAPHDPRTGTLLVAPESAIGAVGRELAAGRLLVALVDESLIHPAHTLRTILDDAVEGALAFRGALPPAAPLDAPVDTSILDQVQRARALGCSGLGLLVPSLVPLCDEHGRLKGEDAETFVAWLGATRRSPVVLVVGEGSRGVSMLAPVSIGALAKQARNRTESLPPPPPVPAPAIQLELQPLAVEPSEPAPPVAETCADAPTTPECPGVDAEASDPEPVVVEAAPTAAPVPATLVEAADEPDEPSGGSLRDAMRKAITGKNAKPRKVEPPRPDPSAAIVRAKETAQARAGRDRRREMLQSLAHDLEQAKGPKPPRVLEQLFATRYLPLLEFVSDGPVDPQFDALVATFRETFERSYTEGFAAIRLTGKRPSMVFDAPDIAARLARLNGARQVHLVLVDSMSYAIGERVIARLKPLVDRTAICVEKTTLWSALPTDTATQMTLLARGIEGLRDGAAPSEPDPGIARGRAVTTLRRERIGQRELLKLDVVEARLRGLGPSFSERLDAISDEVADALARHVSALPPRSLCFVFGDHGFELPVSPDGTQTGEARHGGASPEEVLVPAFAMLTGAAH